MIISTTTDKLNLPVFDANGKQHRYPCYAEIKYDGEYNEYHPKDNILVNKYGKSRTACPITDELKGVNAVIRGELVYGDGKFGGIYKLNSNKSSHELVYYMFDCLELNGTSLLTLPYKDRKIALESVIGEVLRAQVSSSHIRIAYAVEVHDHGGIQQAYEYAINARYEGIVIKNSNSVFTPWFKCKKKETLDLAVTSIDQMKERVTVGYKGRDIGLKVLNPIKRDLVEGMIVEVEHQGVLDKGGLRHPVFKRVRADKEVPDA